MSPIFGSNIGSMPPSIPIIDQTFVKKDEEGNIFRITDDELDQVIDQYKKKNNPKENPDR